MLYMLVLSFHFIGGETGPEKGIDLPSGYLGHQWVRGNDIVLGRGEKEYFLNTYHISDPP